MLIRICLYGLCLSLGLWGTVHAQGNGKKPAFGTITTLSLVPAIPGYPEGVAVDGDRVFVSGPARFGTAGTGPSTINIFDRKNGALKQTITVVGEALEFEHALSNLAIDDAGRVYALSTQLGLIRFTKAGPNYVQQPYGAPLPNLPPIAGPDLPPIPNDVTFDDCGYAYVTDSLQATIFRYPPGGGTPTVWFQSPLLMGGGPIPFGPNGIRLDKSREYIYFVSSTSAEDPLRGTIYRLPLVNSPTADDLEVIYEYNNGEIPDQIAVGRHGTLYISLAISNEISMLTPDGIELGRIASQPTDSIPLDNPAALAFDNRSKSLLVANHASISGNIQNFAVLKVYVNDTSAE